MSSSESALVYRFGPFRLSPGEYSVFRYGEPVELAPKAYEILHALVASKGEVLRKDELLGRVWKDSSVDEGILAVTVHGLRKALRIEGEAIDYIATVPRVGYRLAVPVDVVSDSVSGGGRRRLVILPFRVIGRLDQPDVLSMGLTQDLVARFTNYGDLVTLTTRASQRFNGLEEAQYSSVFGELGVDLLLVGCLQVTATSIRVTTQLLKAPAAISVWAYQFDVERRDMLRTQDEIVSCVVEALAPRLGNQPHQLASRVTQSSEAYEAYMMGQLTIKSEDELSLWKGLALFREALDLDPGFALAWTALADCYVMLGGVHDLPAEYMPRAMRAAKRALAVSPDLGEAHQIVAMLNDFYTYGLALARQHHERAITLRPNAGATNCRFGVHLIATGERDRGLRLLTHAQHTAKDDPRELMMIAYGRMMARDYEGSLALAAHLGRVVPLSWMGDFQTANVNTMIGDHQAAEASARKALERAPNSSLTKGTLAFVLARAGYVRDALEVLETLRDGQAGSVYYRVLVYLALGERQKAMVELGHAFEIRETFLLWTGVDPRLDGLRDGADFRQVLHRINWPPDASPMAFATTPVRS